MGNKCHYSLSKFRESGKGKICLSENSGLLATDEDGKGLLRFKLPDQEKDFFQTLDILFPN